MTESNRASASAGSESELEDWIGKRHPCIGVGSLREIEPSEDVSRLRLDLDLRDTKPGTKVVLPRKTNLTVAYCEPDYGPMLATALRTMIADRLEQAGYNVRKRHRR